MKKFNFDFLPAQLRLWLPPLVGIPAMLLLGVWSPAARFLLFTHHLFWMASIILFINPVGETFWPSPTSRRRGRPSPQPSSKARRRAETRQDKTERQSTRAAETPAEHLARLQKRKEVVDQEIEKLTAKSKERAS
jgi:hypothetical protein